MQPTAEQVAEIINDAVERELDKAEDRARTSGSDATEVQLTIPVSKEELRAISKRGIIRDAFLKELVDYIWEPASITPTGGLSIEASRTINKDDEIFFDRVPNLFQMPS